MDTTNTQDKFSQTMPSVGIDLDEVNSVERQRILVVEDEPDTILLLKQILRLAGFNVLSAVTGPEAIKKVSDLSPHLVLLDLMMPEMDGFEIFGYVRQISNIPIIMVSALNSKEDVVRGLENGADDYIPKPFHNAEMIERVKTVLRRSGMPQEISRLVFPAVDLVVDLKTQEIRLHQKPIQLTPREFSVMAILAKHAPVIVSYQIICNEIWGEDSSEARKRTKYLVYLLRKKLDQAVPDLDLIINLDRLGYKLQTDR